MKPDGVVCTDSRRAKSLYLNGLESAVRALDQRVSELMHMEIGPPVGFEAAGTSVTGNVVARVSSVVCEALVEKWSMEIRTRRCRSAAIVLGAGTRSPKPSSSSSVRTTSSFAQTKSGTDQEEGEDGESKTPPPQEQGEPATTVSKSPFPPECLSSGDSEVDDEENMVLQAGSLKAVAEEIDEELRQLLY